MSERIELSTEAETHCERKGIERHDTLSNTIDAERTAAGGASADGHIMGFKSEFATAHHYDIPVDDSVGAFGDDGHDHVVEINGEREEWDVKAVRNPNGALRCRVDKQVGADAIILTHTTPDADYVELIGFCSHEQLMGDEISRSEAIQMLGGGEEVVELVDEAVKRGWPLTNTMEMSKYGWLNYRVEQDDLDEIPAKNDVDEWVSPGAKVGVDGDGTPIHKPPTA